jgi:MFS family permease
MTTKYNSLRQSFSALKSRNYRLFFFGHFVSLVGSWMQYTALSWLIYRLSGSTLMLGIVAAARMFPIFVLSPFAGVVVDRYNLRRMLQAVQILAMLQALFIGILTYMGNITPLHIIILSLLLGIVNALDIVARQAFVVDMLDDRKDLPNAIALNSSVINLGRLIGPSLAGLLFIWFDDESICFFVNAASYLALVLALSMMRIKSQSKGHGKHGVVHEFMEGIRYVVARPHIFYMLLFLAIFSLMGFPTNGLMAAYVKDILRLDMDSYGFFMAFIGLGALLGGLYLASRSSVVGLEKVIPIGALVFGAALVMLSFVREEYTILLLMLIIGFGMMIIIASTNTVLQSLVDDGKRGRVMGLYTMCFLGMGPFGNLMAGWLAEEDMLGIEMTFLLLGNACAGIALVLLLYGSRLQKHIRPIYRRKGMLPEVARGLETSAELTSASKE